MGRSVGSAMGTAQIALFERAWGKHPNLTPRQAYAIASTLAWWGEHDLPGWIDDPREPLHEVGPFIHFDRRVLFHVDGNRAWADAVRARCLVLVDEVAQGTLPSDRPGAFIDEVLFAAALPAAKTYWEDTPEAFEGLMARTGTDPDETPAVDDEDWPVIWEWFDEICRWEDWCVPVTDNHPELQVLLHNRHPFTWFEKVDLSAELRGAQTGSGHAFV